MSQQENENKKKELSSEELKKQESEKVSKENTSENSGKEMSAGSVSDQPKDTTEKPSDNKQEPAKGEIESTDHEDAMLDESASGKATSKLKAQEKENPDEDPYTDLEEKEEAENPFFKEPEVLEEKSDDKDKSEKKISDSTDNEDAMVSESEAKKTAAQDEEDEDDDLDSDIGDAVVDENKKSSGNHEEDMDSAVAEDSEDESANERHDIEKKDYHAMSQEALADELEKLLKKEKIQAIKEHVAEIRAEFNAKFDEEMEEKKEEFLADGGNIIDFHYSTPLKKRFSSIYFDYKEQRNNYYKRLKRDLNENLNKRLELIEELKGLLDVEENINTTYNHFKEIQEKWRTAGPIPRDRYNNVWNTYHHHVENFYDFLHLNREFRDMDFKHNLEQKLKVIDRAEELAQETNVNRAFRELQMLHKMWKEELGPVAKEYREDIWERFSAATKKIHDKRQEYFSQLDEEYEKNWERKQEIIEKIKEIADQDFESHNKWQQMIKEIEALREKFFSAGKVPRSKNQETWTAFKENVRRFNRKKNAFYKNLKKQQYENLEKKKELIQIAEDNKDSDDFKTVTPLMKKIQADWKKIGHVPRKDSDKVWKQFKKACNHYFDRMHAQRNEDNKEEIEAFEKKKEILDKVKSIELTGKKKEDLAIIKEQINNWKEIGKVPYNKRFIEGKFNKALDQLFKKMDVDHTKAEMMKYENKVQALDDADDDKKIRNEHYFLTKKIEETKSEIRQLENNLQFFSNVDDDNPLVQEVHKNIENHKADLEVWEEKLRKIKSLY
ncbi:DUF349 domain-containing protein [Christiangramia aestuarii]|uniref:DUF349 domain-containing protein n=1 Tax=Christiangramia aestuarii TaxID=1028746 RepID=A0A7K1LRY8_9FLAO|nr:DUF349 domain-containing protein [Christiangramia aestuarii]MUP43569.1 DUF349 domain-containing protein [Christiangramia aestuarii]